MLRATTNAGLVMMGLRSRLTKPGLFSTLLSMLFLRFLFRTFLVLSFFFMLFSTLLVPLVFGFNVLSDVLLVPHLISNKLHLMCFLFRIFKVRSYSLFRTFGAMKI
jgi:hypothetical protein